MSERTVHGVVLILLVMTAGAAAQVAVTAAFRHQRQVLPGGPGGNRLEVDVSLLAGAASGLRDLRLFDSYGDEVPYLLVGPPRQEPAWRPGQVVPIAATKDASGFEVDLGQALLVDRLELGGIPAPFLKRVRLEGGGDRSRWVLLVGEGTLFDLPEERLTRLVLEFAPGEYRYLRVVWDDRQSGRVPLPGLASARLVGAVAPPPPLSTALPFVRLGSEPGESRYRLRLPAAGLPVAALELDVPPGHCLRPARVSEAHLVGSEIRPEPLGEATLRRTVRDDLVAGDLRIAIVRPREAELDLEIDDGSNAPLDLRGVRALLQPQPWVYFESRGGRPLVARYGSPGLEPPRYDLEAVRDELERGPGVRVRGTASWGEVQQATAAAAEPASATLVSSGAPIDPTRFRFMRPVPSGPPGLVALRLDAAILAGSDDLADVRLVDDQNRQVPYVVERMAEPLVLKLPPVEPAPGALPAAHALPGRSLYRITLPYPTLPPARLVLTTSLRVFERPVTLLREARVREPRAAPVVEILGSTAWRHADPDTPPPPLTLELPRQAGSELLLALDEGDNSPLPLAPPTLYLPAFRLRYVRSDDRPLCLVYGQPGLAAPRYDLALLAPRLLGAVATELSPGPAAERATAGVGWEAQRTLFWATLVAVVVVLLTLVVRLVRRGEGSGRVP